MQAKIKYDFSAKLWQHNSPGGWFFVTLPESVSKEIRENLGWQEEGWGRMKASVELRNITWDSAIWYDKKMNSYMLPIKADIRKKTGVLLDEEINVRISI